jgi:hypothetical protein
LAYLCEQQLADDSETIQQVWQGVEMAVTARQTFYHSLFDLQKQQTSESQEILKLNFLLN